MIKKFSIICLVLMFSILPIFTLSGCGLGDAAQFSVAVPDKVVAGTSAEEFLKKCTYTFTPGNEEYFIVRSKTEAEKYGSENKDWIKESEWTYKVKYKNFNNDTYDTVVKANVVITISGYGYNGYDSSYAIITMYGETCRVKINWEGHKPGH
ncbi:MAG: hypothetical protein ACLRFL_03415 [Clostridia bacterium]